MIQLEYTFFTGKQGYLHSVGGYAESTVLLSMSKDFGSNGLRVGVLVSQHNKQLIKSFNGSAILMKISSPAVSD